MGGRAEGADRLGCEARTGLGPQQGLGTSCLQEASLRPGCQDMNTPGTAAQGLGITGHKPCGNCYEETRANRGGGRGTACKGGQVAEATKETPGRGPDA